MARDDNQKAAAEPGAAAKRDIAVAIAFDPDAAGATPRVVASGRGKLAERILDLAFAKGVKVREDPDLAEILAAVDVDSVIPLEAFMAVAEILAYVYRANGQAVPGALGATAAAPAGEGAP